MKVLFTDIFNMSIAASILIIAVILFRFALKNSPKWVRGILWLLVALRLTIPFNFESPFSLVPNAQNIDSTTNSSTSYASTLVNSDSFKSIQNTLSESGEIEVALVISYIWVFGVGLMLAYMLFSYLKQYFRVRESIMIEDNILICDRISSPFVFGIINPRIYLPSDLSEQNKQYVIAHEKAHIKRFDYIIKPLSYLILSLHFFNPLCWIAFSLFTKDIELACDERVVKSYSSQDKKGYTSALLSCSIKQNIPSVCPFSIGEDRLKQRIKSVLSYKKPSVTAVLLSVTVCILTVASFMTNPITSQFSINTDNSNSAIHKLKNFSFDFAEQPTTSPVTEPTTVKPTEPEKSEKEEETKPKQEAVENNEQSEEYFDYYSENYYDDYSDESYDYYSDDSDDSSSWNGVDIQPFTYNPEDYVMEPQGRVSGTLDINSHNDNQYENLANEKIAWDVAQTN